MHTVKRPVKIFLRENLVIFAVGFSVFFWFFESAVHSFIFKESGFYDQVFTSDLNEIWMRLVVIALVAGLSIYGHGIIKSLKKTEAALHESKGLYTTLAESASDFIYILNRDLVVVYANNAAKKAVGYEQRDLSGKRADEILCDEDFKKLKPRFNRVFDSEVPLNFEEKLTLNGAAVLLNISLAPLPGPHGASDYIMGISRDVTALKMDEELLREERDRARTYLDIAPVIFLILDKDQNVTLVNREGADTLGYSEDEILGRNWVDNFVPKGIRDELRQGFQSILAGKTDFLYHENPVLRKDGIQRLIAWRNIVMKDASGVFSGVLSAGDDITEQRLNDEALKDRIEELERFRKATIEREFRIRELKEKLEALERELREKKAM